jgi:hypothetical protein
LFRFSRAFPRWFAAGTLLDADYENPDLGGKDGSEVQSRKEVKIGVTNRQGYTDPVDLFLKDGRLAD